MSLENKNVQSYKIYGVDENYLQLVKFVDSLESGRVKWFIKDQFDNTTPVFENNDDIIPITKKSCMFLGKTLGKTKLYVVKGSEKKQNELFDSYEIDGNPKELINIDNKSLIVRSQNGIYFFDKEIMKRTSEMFDVIKVKTILEDNAYVFEKNIKGKDLDITNKIIGTVTSNGKIGNFIYDESLNGLRTTPIITGKESYDLFDYETIYKDLKDLDEKKKKEKEVYIKNLLKINKR